MIEYQVSVNGIDVVACYSQAAVNGIFIPLLKKLIRVKICIRFRPLEWMAFTEDRIIS